MRPWCAGCTPSGPHADSPQLTLDPLFLPPPPRQLNLVSGERAWHMAGSPAQPDSTLGVSIGTRLCWETPGWRTTLELGSVFLMHGPVDVHGRFCPQRWRISGTSRSPLRGLNADRGLGKRQKPENWHKAVSSYFFCLLRASSGMFYLGGKNCKVPGQRMEAPVLLEFGK